MDKGISPYFNPRQEAFIQVMSKMHSPYPEIAERAHITSSWEEFDNFTKYHLLEKEILKILKNEKFKKKECIIINFREPMLNYLHCCGTQI